VDAVTRWQRDPPLLSPPPAAAAAGSRLSGTRHSEQQHLASPCDGRAFRRRAACSVAVAQVVSSARISGDGSALKLTVVVLTHMVSAVLKTPGAPAVAARPTLARRTLISCRSRARGAVSGRALDSAYYDGVRPRVRQWAGGHPRSGNGQAQTGKWVSRLQGRMNAVVLKQAEAGRLPWNVRTQRRERVSGHQPHADRRCRWDRMPSVQPRVRVPMTCQEVRGGTTLAAEMAARLGITSRFGSSGAATCG
jgi:hypothetical protein